MELLLRGINFRSFQKKYISMKAMILYEKSDKKLEPTRVSQYHKNS